jgi:hypothetical protein
LRCSSDEDRAAVAVPRRAHGGHRVRQELVRGAPLRPDRGHLLGLLPRPRGRRRQRPGRDRRRLRGAAPHRGQAARARAADGDRRDQCAEGVAGTARGAGARPRPVPGGDRPRHAARRVPRAQRRAPGPCGHGRSRRAPARLAAASLAALPAARGVPLHVGHPRRRGRRDRAQAAVDRPAPRARAVRHHRRRPRLPRRARRAAGRARSSSATTSIAGRPRRTCCGS